MCRRRQSRKSATRTRSSRVVDGFIFLTPCSCQSLEILRSIGQPSDTLEKPKAKVSSNRRSAESLSRIDPGRLPIARRARRRHQAACRLAIVLSLLLVAQAHAATFLEHWRAVCDDFREGYSYTAHKGVDWTEIFDLNRGRFEGELTPAQFATNLHESLLVLHDWHVAVQTPAGTWLGQTASYPRNYPSRLATNHAATPYANYLGAGALYHARLTNDAVHLIVPTLDTATLDQVSDDDLLALFRSFENARGLIVDLRFNSGGNELHARRLASFFVRDPTLYGYTRTRAPSEPGGFTPLTARQVIPHERLRLSLPLAVLIGQHCLSSCEWLTLMLRQAPNAVLMGDRTRGGTGNPILRSIPELGVSYLYSRWIGYTPEQEIIEDRGIFPAMRLRPEWSYDDPSGRDFLLEHAIDCLEWRHDIGDPASPMNRGTDSDGDGVGDASEFVAATGPFDPGSFLRVGISGPGPTLTWTSADRRALIILESILPTGPWVEHPASPVFSPQSSLPLAFPGAGRFFRLRAELAPGVP